VCVGGGGQEAEEQEAGAVAVAACSLQASFAIANWIGLAKGAALGVATDTSIAAC
jgi:hypothetical protein